MGLKIELKPSDGECGFFRGKTRAPEAGTPWSKKKKRKKDVPDFICGPLLLDFVAYRPSPFVTEVTSSAISRPLFFLLHLHVSRVSTFSGSSEKFNMIR